MTKRNKIVLLTSIVLALGVIAGIILYAVNNKTNNIISFIYIGIVILLGIGSVPLIYFLKVRKSKFEKLLDDKYFLKYEIIKDAVKNSQLSNMSKKEITEDVLDMLISAQKSGKSAEEVIEDPEVFIREIITTYASPGRLAVLNIIDGVIYFVCFVLGASILLWFEHTDMSFFKTGVDINMILFFFIISFIIVSVTKKLTSTKNYWMAVIPVAFGILFVLLSEMLRHFFYDLELVRQFLDGTVRMVPNIVMLAVYLIVVPVAVIIKSFIRKKLLRTTD